MKQNIRLIAALLGSVWFLCPATPAHAIAIFDFDISYIDGVYAGHTLTGTLTTNSRADGHYTPSGSSGGLRLLSFQASQLDATDDRRFPAYPLVGIASGDIVAIDFVGQRSADYGPVEAQIIDYDIAAGRNYAWINNGDGDTSSGYVSATRYVPEPSTLTLLGIGLAGMGFTRRMKKA